AIALLALAVPFIAACDSSSDESTTAPPGGTADPTRLDDAAEALGDGDIQEAQTIYENQVSSAPNDAEALFGSVLTGLLLLPESAPVDDLLASCGVAPIDLDDLVFGASGALGWERASRDGTANLAISVDSQSVPVSPIAVRTSIESVAFSDPSFLLEVILNDPYDSGGRGEQLRLSLSGPASGWVGDLELNSTNAQSSPLQFSASLDRTDPNGTGTFIFASSFGLESGTITLTSPPPAVGNTFTLTFTNVVFDLLDDSFSTLTLNGSVTDSVDGPLVFARNRVPVFRENFTAVEDSADGDSALVDALDRCGPAVDEVRVLDALDGLADEIAVLRQRLDRIVANDGDGFRFTIPAETLANPDPVTIGVVSLRALRASLRVYEALSDAVGQDHFFQAGLETMLDGTGASRTLNRSAAVAELNTSFAAVDQAPMWDPALTDGLTAAVDDAKAAWAANPTGVAINPGNGSVAGRVEVDAALDTVRSSLTGEATLTETPEYRIHPSRVLQDPPTREDMRAQAGNGDIWFLSEFDEVQFVDDVAVWLVEQLITVPEDPSMEIPCADDTTCIAVNATYACNDFTSGLTGFCTDNPSQSCGSDSDCLNFFCSFQVCGARSPVFADEDALDSLDDGGRFSSIVVQERELVRAAAVWQELSFDVAE
ncbi:MAG: hypothetical protein AAF658_05545, partial [Myxococcota bacterium]